MRVGMSAGNVLHRGMRRVGYECAIIIRRKAETLNLEDTCHYVVPHFIANNCRSGAAVASPTRGYNGMKICPICES